MFPNAHLGNPGVPKIAPPYILVLLNFHLWNNLVLLNLHLRNPNASEFPPQNPCASSFPSLEYLCDPEFPTQKSLRHLRILVLLNSHLWNILLLMNFHLKNHYATEFSPQKSLSFWFPTSSLFSKFPSLKIPLCFWISISEFLVLLSFRLRNTIVLLNFQKSKIFVLVKFHLKNTFTTTVPTQKSLCSWILI